MKTKITLTFLILILTFLSGNTQTIWTGEKITFNKANFADYSLEVNQDRITDIVWITRGNDGGIYNIYSEDFFDNPNKNTPSPMDTQWAYGTTSNISSLTFDTWLKTISPDGILGPPDSLNQDMVLYLMTDHIYIDIKFLSWTTGKTEVEPGVFGGGGFSYERSTDQNLGINDFKYNKTIAIYPNPSSEFIQLKGLTDTQKIKIYNVLGGKVSEESVNSNSKIEIKNLPKGIYFIHLENGTAVKFVKN